MKSQEVTLKDILTLTSNRYLPPPRVCKSCDHFVQVTFVAKDTISSHDTEPVWLLHHGGGKITITLHFQGHYNEPDVNINFSSVRGQSQLSITLTSYYNLYYYR